MAYPTEHEDMSPQGVAASAASDRMPMTRSTASHDASCAAPLVEARCQSRSGAIEFDASKTETSGAILAWQEAHGRLLPAFDCTDRDAKLAALQDGIAAYKQLTDASASTSSQDATWFDAFAFTLLQDGLADGETVYRVCWHGVGLGELVLSLEPLSNALGGPGWMLAPSLPIALPGRVVLEIGVPPRPAHLLGWLRDVVDPVAVERRRIEVARRCLAELRFGAELGGEAWLAAIEQGEVLGGHQAKT